MIPPKLNALVSGMQLYIISDFAVSVTEIALNYDKDFDQSGNRGVNTWMDRVAAITLKISLAPIFHPNFDLQLHILLFYSD